ncbi:MAG: PIN domain-containing protein [Dehalococcoidia bacterium]|nr:PIN domain-containing protein [Dehalococcoidia bacterium]
MTLAFLDTNVILRHLLGDHPDHSPRATAFLQRIEQGETQVRTADTVVFEVVFTLERQYRRPKVEIRDVLLPLIDLPGIVLPGKRRLHQTFDLYVDLNIPFADAYHAVLMEHFNLDQIISFDRELDRVVGIQRVEP